jgi:hypothetical protein
LIIILSLQHLFLDLSELVCNTCVVIWKRIFIVIVVVLIVILGIVVAHHYIAKHRLSQNKDNKQVSQIQPTIKVLPSLKLMPSQSSVVYWPTYTSSISGYTFRYPPNWVVNRNKKSPYDDVTILPKETFAAVVRIQDASSDTPRLAYFATPRANYSIVEKNLIFGKVSAKEYDATTSSPGSSGQKITDSEVVFSVNKISYDIQLLDYAEKQTFYNILSTFSFPNPTLTPSGQ